jgi:transcriptional regulator with XRE-family HTH domain
MLPLPLLVSGLGRVIRRLRKRAGYSQDRFGAAVGIHRTYAGLLERGKTNPTLEVVHAVAEALGMSVVELLTLATSEAIQPKPDIPQAKVGPVRRVAEPSDRKPAKAKRRNRRRGPQ